MCKKKKNSLGWESVVIDATCPICGEKLEIIARITGYLAPVTRFNEGKKKELKNRRKHDC